MAVNRSRELMFLVECLASSTSTTSSVMAAVHEHENIQRNDELMLLGAYEPESIKLQGKNSPSVPRILTYEFPSGFGMQRSTFEVILSRLNLTSRKHSAETKLLAFLWFIGNPETFKCVSDRFDMAKSTLHLIISEVSDAILSHATEAIVYPDNYERWHNTAKGFRVPGVVGCVHGTYIPMGKKGDKRDTYICNGGYPAMHTQIVSDSNLRILDILTGYPGSVSNSYVFKSSPLYMRSRQLPPEFHLLGDSSYHLEMCLITPYKDTGYLTPRQTHFNIVLESDLICAEKCIGLLKGKFRRLQNFDCRDTKLMCKMVVSAAVLHNLILEKEMIKENEIFSEENNRTINSHDVEVKLELNSPAERKRDWLSSAL